MLRLNQKQKFNKSISPLIIGCAKQSKGLAVSSLKEPHFFSNKHVQDRLSEVDVNDKSKPEFYTDWKGHLVLRSGLVDYERRGLLSKWVNPILLRTPFERFKNSLCIGKPKESFYASCGNCAEPMRNKEGKIVTFIKVCGSPYCSDVDCIKQRKFIAKKKFMLFFNAYPNWRTERGNRWVHITFGFARQQFLLTKKEIQEMRSDVIKTIKECEKEFGIKIKGIGVRDLAHDVEKIGEEFFIHFHLAHRPTKFIAKKKWIAIAKKHNCLYNFIGFRKANQVAEYFAGRDAGMFGHEVKGTCFSYSDVIDEETYFKTFHKTRRILCNGFTLKELRFIRSQAAAIRKTESFALVNIKNAITFPPACQKCGCKEWNFIFSELKVAEPPPNQKQPKITFERLAFPNQKCQKNK